MHIDAVKSSMILFHICITEGRLWLPINNIRSNPKTLQGYTTLQQTPSPYRGLYKNPVHTLTESHKLSELVTETTYWSWTYCSLLLLGNHPAGWQLESSVAAAATRANFKYVESWEQNSVVGWKTTTNCNGDKSLSWTMLLDLDICVKVARHTNRSTIYKRFIANYRVHRPLSPAYSYKI